MKSNGFRWKESKENFLFLLKTIEVSRSDEEINIITSLLQYFLEGVSVLSVEHQNSNDDSVFIF